MSGPAPSIGLCCHGRSFPVEIAVILERCSLFRQNPRLLAAPDYSVTSDVRSSSFLEFVRSLRGEPYLLDRSTVAELSQLAQEFGCQDLSTACSSFGDAPNPDGQASLYEGMCFLKEQQVALMRQIELQNLQLARVQQDRQSSAALMRSLEQQVLEQQRQLSRLQGENKALSDRLGALEVLRATVESEQLYRRGCEYFYGTNGFGLRAQDISQRLGLTELRRAADSGHSDAQYVCGRILRECPTFEDASASTRFMKSAADNGNSYGEMGYARALDFGYGVGQSDEEAFAYYRRSAEHGNARGQNGCGYCFEFGKGVQKDLAIAAQYYWLGAEQGNGPAQGNFGLCLRDGKGVPKNNKRAADYIRRAKESQGE
jgi:TPR repeat protein